MNRCCWRCAGRPFWRSWPSLLPCEAMAGEFRFLLEGEAGMRGDGDYRGLDEDLNGGDGGLGTRAARRIPGRAEA